mgnify:CR=1 FL=1
MIETGAKLAETAAKKAELAKEIQKLEKEAKFKESLIATELKNGQSTVGTAEGLRQTAAKLKMKTSELNRLN